MVAVAIGRRETRAALVTAERPRKEETNNKEIETMYNTLTEEKIAKMQSQVANRLHGGFELEPLAEDWIEGGYEEDSVRFVIEEAKKEWESQNA